MWTNGGRLVAILQEPGYHASGILTLHLGPWLQAVQVGGGALRVSSRLKDRPLIIGEGLQPASEVPGVVRPRFQVGDNSEIA